MAAPSPTEHAVLEGLQELDAWAWSQDWQGTDPYDGLNARRFLTPLKQSRHGRQALVQLVKRSPLNLRPALGIEPAPNAAALAWGISAYATTDFHDRSDEHERRRRELLSRLLALRLPNWDDPCWGYHFDMQSRFLHYPSTEPNVIATCFAGAALLDLHDRTRERELLELAERVGRFLFQHVHQTDDPPGAFFGYHPGDLSPVHNANLHVAAFLARVSALTDHTDWREAAQRGVEWSVSRQRPDGSWPYGEWTNLSWVDGFHTGYVLDSLSTCADAGMEEVEDAWRRGLEYWRTQLFGADGTPRYYSDNTFPIDAECVAQGLQTFSKATSRDPSCLEDAERVFTFAQRRMRRRDGVYMFQRRRHWANPTPHLRGANAEMLLGLACLVAAQRRQTVEGTADRT